PVVLHKEQVKTLPPAVFERVEQLAAPRLVEYWEQDPCAARAEAAKGGLAGAGLRLSVRGLGAGGLGGAVRVEAEFAVGESEIVILGASDSLALDGWLRGHGYRIPAGADAALRPYVEAGMKFFVARVDVAKVKLEGGRAVLSPLRFHYDDDKFQLPV